MNKKMRGNTKKLFLMATAAITIAGIQASYFSAAVSAVGDQGPGGAYELVWNDEFDGTKLDRTKWTYHSGSWKDAGVQGYYTWEDERNVSVGGGSLRLTTRYNPSASEDRKKITSGFVQTKGTGPGGADQPHDNSPFKPSSFKYGYFEARIKMPRNKSTWPAFWMSPMEGKYGGWPQSGEVDIVEAKGTDHSYAAANVHYSRSAAEPNKSKQNQGNAQIDDTTEWHTYAVKWEENRFEFFLDGKSYHVVENMNSDRYPQGSPGHPFNEPFFLRLNLAVGGTYVNPGGGQPESPYSKPLEVLKTNSDPDFKNSFPDTMEVDYVRVYQKNPQLEQQISTKKQELQQLIDRAANPQTTNGMTEATKQALNEEVAKARAALTNLATTSQGFTDHITALQQALANLRADRQVLTDALANYGTQPAYVKADQAVADALKQAQETNQADNPSAQDVQAHANALSQAIATAVQAEAGRKDTATKALEAAEQAFRDAAANTLPPLDLPDLESKLAAVKDDTARQQLTERLNNLKQQRQERQQQLDQAAQTLAERKAALKKLLDQAVDPATTQGMTTQTADQLKQAAQAAQPIYQAGDSQLAAVNQHITALQQALANLRADKQVLVDALNEYDAQPEYVKNHSRVGSAFRRAQGTRRAPQPRPSEVRADADELRAAIAAAKQEEQAAQDASTQALAEAAAELAKNLPPTELPKVDIPALEALVKKVNDPIKQQEITKKLDEVKTAFATRKQAVDAYLAQQQPPANAQPLPPAPRSADQPTQAAHHAGQITAPNTGHQRDTSLGLAAMVVGSVTALTGAVFAIRRRQ